MSKKEVIVWVRDSWRWSDGTAECGGDRVSVCGF